MFILALDFENKELSEKISTIFKRKGFKSNLVRHYTTNFDSLMYINTDEYNELEGECKLIEYRVDNFITCILEDDLIEDSFNIICLDSVLVDEIKLKGHICLTVSLTESNSTTDYKLDTSYEESDLQIQCRIIVEDLINRQYINEYGLKESKVKLK